ncbi:kinase-like domain-containing protein [Xylaria sp. FL1777]|nr:kinase-like domain-containing protein [Xylaria sp. FL1777]
MASYTPVKLPYFAPAPAPLPSYEEIIVQEPPHIAFQLERRVVRFGDHFIVKYGRKIDFAEGENMLLVRQYTNIPIPTLYAMYEHEPSGNKVIIMEYIAGQVLSNCYDFLNAERKASIGSQLRHYLNELRMIPSLGFYGLPGGRPYLPHNWIFKNGAGPFYSAGDFLEAYLESQFPGSSKLFEDLKSQFLELSKNHDAPVFTHGDLQTQNIILREDGLICIIDWESASYSPEYFDFFCYGTYDMVVSGLSEGDKDCYLAYAKLVDVINKVWEIGMAKDIK